MKADVVENMKKKTVMPIIQESVELKSTVYTDEFQSYATMSKVGFKHDFIEHGIKEYVRGNVHTNTIEGFWSQLKRSIHGTYHSVSPKHLQLYVDEFAWRYNHRISSASIFHCVGALRVSFFKFFFLTFYQYYNSFIIATHKSSVLPHRF